MLRKNPENARVPRQAVCRPTGRSPPPPAAHWGPLQLWPEPLQYSPACPSRTAGAPCGQYFRTAPYKRDGLTLTPTQLQIPQGIPDSRQTRVPLASLRGRCTMPDSSWLLAIPPLLLTTGPLHRRFLCLHPTSRHCEPLASNSCCFVRDESPMGHHVSGQQGLHLHCPWHPDVPSMFRHCKHGLTWLHVTRGAVRLGHPDVERP